jgi:Pterin binding enzyme
MIAPSEFVVIGENIHATRIVKRSGPRVTTDEHGREAVVFTDVAGGHRQLPVPEAEQQSAAYVEGKVKHVRIAIQAAMSGAEPDAPTALAYLEAQVARQVEAGARYLDLNVDEVSLALPEQIEAMRWLVRTVSAWTQTPVSIDSPNIEIIEAGLDEALRCGSEPPMLNSVSLERIAALELAVRSGGPVVVTAAGESGIPGDVEGRLENAGRIVELALERGIALERIYVDPLIFPISVNGASGEHCLETYRRLRERFGAEIHLTGGMSNVSFGLPNRRLLNDAFLLLAIEAGADSGIVDPVANNIDRVFALDRETPPFRLAADVLTGADRNCRAYLKAYRAGELELPKAAAG